MVRLRTSRINGCSPLALDEAATRIQDGAPGVTDEIWDAAADHVTGERTDDAPTLDTPP